jgi:hypothetical protein
MAGGDQSTEEIDEEIDEEIGGPTLSLGTMAKRPQQKVRIDQPHPAHILSGFNTGHHGMCPTAICCQLW